MSDELERRKPTEMAKMFFSTLAFVHFSESLGIYFRLPRQSRYGLRLGHDRPSPER